MVPTAPIVRNGLAAVACAAAAAFGVMDANPSLYWHHQFLQLQRSFQDGAYRRHFAGKTVWLVGASSGIGEELAYRISPYCRTLILSSRNVDQLNRVAQNCRRNNNNNIVVVPMDVTGSAMELENCLLQKIVPELALPRCDEREDDDDDGPTLDCVIFNAGVGHTSTVQETDAATTLQMLQVNALPPMLLTQFLLRHRLFRPSARPQIVLVSSVGGRLGLPLSAAYAASKHALHGFAASLRSETGSWLRVDVICPGTIDDTGFFANQPSQNESKPTETTVLDQKRQPDKKKSPLKMPVQRCASLMVTQMTRNISGGEAWIAQQPTLLGLYLHQYLPGVWNYILNRVIGPKRVSLYNQGLDLYDPSSWTKRKG